MARYLLAALLFVFAFPAFAKPHNEKPPIPCSDLWTAVTETLGNAGNYKVVAMNNDEMKANFIVVGALFSQMNMVQLKPKDTGCDLQLKIGFSGNDDEGAFRNRISRALKKLNTAKPSARQDTGAAQ